MWWVKELPLPLAMVTHGATQGLHHSTICILRARSRFALQISSHTIINSLAILRWVGQKLNLWSWSKWVLDKHEEFEHVIRLSLWAGWDLRQELALAKSTKVPWLGNMAIDQILVPSSNDKLHQNDHVFYALGEIHHLPHSCPSWKQFSAMNWQFILHMKYVQRQMSRSQYFRTDDKLSNGPIAQIVVSGLDP